MCGGDDVFLARSWLSSDGNLGYREEQRPSSVLQVSRVCAEHPGTALRVSTQRLAGAACWMGAGEKSSSRAGSGVALAGLYFLGEWFAMLEAARYALPCSSLAYIGVDLGMDCCGVGAKKEPFPLQHLAVVVARGSCL